MTDLSPEKILELKLGDLISTPSLMGTLTPEETVLQVDLVKPGGVGFRVLFFGVKIGSALFSLKKGEPKWIFKPA